MTSGSPASPGLPTGGFAAACPISGPARPNPRVPGPVSLALLLNRFSLGLCFLAAGVMKLRMGVHEFYTKAFLGLRPAWLPDLLAWPYGHALPFVEVLVGGLLIIGLFTRVTAGVMTVMLISFTIALMGAGMFFQNGQPFHTNVILGTLAFLLATLGGGRWSLDHALWGGRG
jgi:uncharacterized membrane protein YphA (DoxX/SURF4 family)